jgi:hypothetical protein
MIPFLSVALASLLFVSSVHSIQLVPGAVCRSSAEVAGIVDCLTSCRVATDDHLPFPAWLRDHQAGSRGFTTSSNDAFVIQNLTVVVEAAKNAGITDVLRIGPLVHVTLHPLTAIEASMADASFSPQPDERARLVDAVNDYVSFHTSLLGTLPPLVEDDAPQLLAYEEATLAALVTFLNLPFRGSVCPGGTRPTDLTTPEDSAVITWTDIDAANATLGASLWQLTQRLGYGRTRPPSLAQQVIELTAADDAGLVRKVWEVAVTVVSVLLPLACCALIVCLCVVRRYERTDGRTQRRRFR